MQLFNCTLVCTYITCVNVMYKFTYLNIYFCCCIINSLKMRSVFHQVNKQIYIYKIFSQYSHFQLYTWLKSGVIQSLCFVFWDCYFIYYKYSHTLLYILYLYIWLAKWYSWFDIFYRPLFLFILHGLSIFWLGIFSTFSVYIYQSNFGDYWYLEEFVCWISE